MGGIVCATESGAGCPDLPGCYGPIMPPLQVHSIIEYTDTAWRIRPQQARRKAVMLRVGR
jgi:heme A synthase